MKKVVFIIVIMAFAQTLAAQYPVKFKLYVIDFCQNYPAYAFDRDRLIREIYKHRECVLTYDVVQVGETINEKVEYSLNNAKEVEYNRFIYFINFYFLLKLRTGFLQYEYLVFSTEGIYYYKGKYYKDKELLEYLLPFIPEALRCGME